MFDHDLLLFVHGHVPRAFGGFFEVVTNTGSLAFLLPLTVVVALTFFWRRRHSEALLVALSTGLAEIVVYVLKISVGRVRPNLWSTDWYWGSSFPSGHTLVVAAFATAWAICIGRIRPRYRRIAWTSAFSWIFLVGLSRLVLGVHWPSDVLAAAAIGTLLPLAIDRAQIASQKKRRRPVPPAP